MVRSGCVAGTGVMGACMARTGVMAAIVCQVFNVIIIVVVYHINNNRSIRPPIVARGEAALVHHVVKGTASELGSGATPTTVCLEI